MSNQQAAGRGLNVWTGSKMDHPGQFEDWKGRRIYVSTPYPVKEGYIGVYACVLVAMAEHGVTELHCRDRNNRWAPERVISLGKFMAYCKWWHRKVSEGYLYCPVQMFDEVACHRHPHITENPLNLVRDDADVLAAAEAMRLAARGCEPDAAAEQLSLDLA